MQACNHESVKTVGKRRQEPAPSFRPGAEVVKQVCQGCGCKRTIVKCDHDEWSEFGAWIPPAGSP